ncbi:SCO family protein [Amphritea pacifica]|uniref:SCO family protein n=1 Tax=Amphritea pacifica TaxID=2811233 RepID=A0ABS2W7H5_9GAMM|nr:SCO family protein [Amphritea pacifica]MBN0987531.1 SCO family protein [Amphritea pacifica]
MNRKQIRSLLTKPVKTGLTVAALALLSTSLLQAHEGGQHEPAMEISSEDSHAQHKAMMAEMKMDHSAHEDHAMATEGEDPHAHHKAMMSNMAGKDQVQRSSHDYKAPHLTMLNQNGEPVAIDKLLNSDKPVLVNFIFTTCPTICPVLSSTFSIVNRELAGVENLSMISISIDPEEDTPEALQRYAKKFEARDNWSFITGSVEDSIQLQKAFDIYRGSKMNHEPVTYLRASADKPWTRLDGFPSSEQLVSEYHHMTMGH